MGQYHTLFNLDKLEQVNPHDLGFGAKQVEHTGFRGSLSDILYVLTAYKVARGGGDFADDNGIFKGRWHGDRVAVIGDYYEDGDLSSEWAYALRPDENEKPQFKSITDEIRPYVETLFDLNGQMDYRPLGEKVAHFYAESK